MSCHWSPEKGSQHIPLCCPPWESCRLQWGHPSVFSSPSWISQVTSVTSHKSCPQGLWLSWSPSSRHTPIVWYPSYIEAPEAAHGTQSRAAPLQRRERQLTPFTGWFCHGWCTPQYGWPFWLLSSLESYSGPWQMLFSSFIKLCEPVLLNLFLYRYSQSTKKNIKKY